MTHTIKLTLTDNDTITTKINGTEQEIYSHYRHNNLNAWQSKENKPQVKKIEFLESPLLKKRSSSCYLFIDWDSNGLLQ